MALMKIRSHDVQRMERGASPLDHDGVIIEAIRDAVRPRATRWGQRQNATRLAIARDAMASVEEIAKGVHRVATSAKRCRAEIERLETDIAAEGVRQLALDLEADELTLLRNALPARVKDEGEIAQLRRDVERAKLVAEKHAIEALDAFTRPAVDRPPELPSPTPSLDAERAAAARKQSEAEARWIIEDVQAGHVPTDPATPYHAFAACVFVSAQLEGLNVNDAAARARQVVLDRIVARHPIFVGDPARYKDQYDELKKRLDALSGSRQTATVLAAMQRLGATAAGGNGNGGGAR